MHTVIILSIQTLHMLFLACQLFPITSMWTCSLLVKNLPLFLHSSLPFSHPPSLPLPPPSLSPSLSLLTLSLPSGIVAVSVETQLS
jgi:hypothetical protein